MAEGGGEVDGGRNIICNICEGGGLSVGADQFCVSCEQYLCEECKQYHSRVKATKSHQVIGIDEIPTLTSLTLGSEALETPTCKDHERPITYFCISHMTELCQTCRLMDHKTCANIIEFEKAVHDLFTKEHSKRLLKSLEEIITHLSKCKDTAQSNRDQLDKSKQSAIDDIKQARKTIDSHLDKIEAAAYVEIDRVYKAAMKQIAGHLHVCDVTIYQMQKCISKLERDMALGDKESEFVTINNETQEIKRQCTIIKDTTESTCVVGFTFIVSDSIDEITQLLPSFGTVSVTKSPSCQSNHGAVAIYNGELKPKSPSDTEDPVIISYETLSAGRQLIADMKNNKLKLYDSNNQFLSELVLNDMPLSVVSLCDSKAVVSLPFIQSLQYITIDTDLAVLKTKTVNYQPVAMIKYGDDILATVRDKLWKVIAIDTNGTVKRTIYQDNGSLFRRPYYIDLSVDQKTVYVVDKYKGCIGLSMNGHVLFQYQEQKVKMYGGLAVGRDYLFICVREGNYVKIRRLSLSGDDSEDLDLGNAVPLELEDNILKIFKRDDKGDWFINFFYLL